MVAVILAGLNSCHRREPFSDYLFAEVPEFDWTPQLSIEALLVETK